VVPLDAYDMVCYEDNETPIYDEIFCSFTEITNYRWFKDTPFVLVLNKYDLFREKIKHKSISCYFKDYKGTTEMDAIEYIVNQFKVKMHNNSKLYPVVMSALGMIRLFCLNYIIIDPEDVRYTVNRLQNLIYYGEDKSFIFEHRPPHSIKKLIFPKSYYDVRFVLQSE
jgi:GTPase SAR1 family protein